MDTPFATPHLACISTRKVAALLVRPFLLALLVLLPAVSSQAGVLDRKPDYSQHDVPLYEQVTNRIKAKILASLGHGHNPRDRYFVIPFAYQNKGNAPEFSHSFISVIRVLADHKQTHLTDGLVKGIYKNREFEAFTISWLPHDFDTNPNLCVFKGFGSRLFPRMNACPLSPGKSFNLEETLRLAVNVKNAVCMWGPYEIRQGGFDLGVQRLRLLEGGSILYRADDRLYRKDHIAINCFHAMAGLNEFYPNGGIFGTGFKMWGINGTARVLMEYRDIASFAASFSIPWMRKKTATVSSLPPSPTAAPTTPSNKPRRIGGESGGLFASARWRPSKLPLALSSRASLSPRPGGAKADSRGCSEARAKTPGRLTNNASSQVRPGGARETPVRKRAPASPKQHRCPPPPLTDGLE